MSPRPTFFALALLAAVPTFAQQPAPTTWTPAQWDAAISQLSSKSFALREQATAALSALNVKDLPTLKERAKSAPDAEVQARLEARIAELEGPALTLQVRAPREVRYGEPLLIRFTIINNRPEPLEWDRQALRIEGASWSAEGMGGSPRDEAVFPKANAKGTVTIPASGRITCELTSRLSLATIGLIKTRFNLRGLPAAEQSMVPRDPTDETLIIVNVLPSDVMEKILHSSTPQERAETQSLFEKLLRQITANSGDAREQLESTLRLTGPYALPYLDQAAAEADPVLREQAIRWYRQASWSISTFNSRLTSRDNYIPPTWLQGLLPGDETAADKAARDLAVKSLADASPQVRTAAVEVLADRGEHDALEKVRLLAKDATPAVRSQVMRFLGQFSEEKEACQTVLDGLLDPEDAVRQAAITALESASSTLPMELLAPAVPGLRPDLAIRLLTLVIKGDGTLPLAVAEKFPQLSSDLQLALLSFYTGHTDETTFRMIQSALSQKDSTLQRVALLRLLPFPAEKVAPVIAQFRPGASADLAPLADAVLKEARDRTLFPFLQGTPVAREKTFAIPSGSMPRVSPDGKWVAYTTRSGDPMLRGLGRKRFGGSASYTHVVHADGTGDQIVSTMPPLQWMNDSTRLATLGMPAPFTQREQAALISDLQGNVVAEFGAKADAPLTPLTREWIKTAQDSGNPQMPHTKAIAKAGTTAAPGFSPDGNWAGPLLSDPNASTLEFLSPSDESVKIAIKDWTPGTAVWSPDSRYIAVVREKDIAILDFSKKTLLGAFENQSWARSYMDYAPVATWNPWSPDSSRLALVRNGQIYTCKPDGTDLHQLTFDAAAKGCPTFSRDGKRIAYIAAFDDKRYPNGMVQTHATLWVLDIQTALAARVTTISSELIRTLDWLDDGTLIFDRSDGSPWAMASEGALLFTTSLAKQP